VYYTKGTANVTIATGVTISQFDRLYWNTSTNTATNVIASGLFYMGYAVSAGSAAGGYVDVALNELPPLSSSVASGITTGSIASKTIATAQLEALLDTNTNNLFSLNAGDTVLEIQIIVGTAAGAACTVDVGLDGTAAAVADTDGIIVDADANAAATYSSDDATYTGALLTADVVKAAAAGNVTITSSSDQSASSFVGWARMYYIPA
jgi:hypothetical protein